MCGPGSPMQDCPSDNVGGVNTPAPHPRPGPGVPAGPDVDELRSAFDDLLGDSAGSSRGDDDIRTGVSDHQVEALDAAHELLATALTALDSTR